MRWTECCCIVAGEEVDCPTSFLGAWREEEKERADAGGIAKTEESSVSLAL